MKYMGKDPNNADKIGWAILLNLAITVTEYIGGMLSGSLALVSDAGHNLTDVISLILGLFGERFSKIKATDRNSFGYKRVEIFTALINALILWGVSLFIIIEAAHRAQSLNNISTGLMLIIAVIGLLGNLFSVLVLSRSRDESLNMKAAYLHLFYDTLSSVAVIIAGVIIYFTKFNMLDIIISILIAVMILWSGFEIIRKAIHIFMQGVPDNVDFDKVYETILMIKGVKSLHGLHIWSIDSNEVFLSCHICMKATNQRNGNDELLNKVNSILQKEFGIYHTAIQVETDRQCREECCR
jgi:cobalt-zinc-cadmium efflux system protein